MNEFEIIKKYDDSEHSNKFSEHGTKTHLKIDGKYYVLSQAWPMDTGYEIMLFAADEKGEIEDFSDLWVTYDLEMSEAIEHLRNNPDCIGDD